MPKKTPTKLPHHPGLNLGRYLHKPKYKAKLKNEPKITKETAKHGKSPPTVKKPSRRKIRKMVTPKEI